ncbi:MAG: aldehyde dehydrogenase family protein, partial [Pseudomonadota bacterium]
RPFTMELGGKSADIVFDDADLDEAVKGAAIAAFSNNGQQCLAGSRILLQEGIAEAFIERFTAAAKSLKIGDPRKDGTQMGPLQSRAHMERVLSFVETARSEECRILAGGARAAGFDRGFYIDPIVVEAPSNAAAVCQDEIFGPFATILRFKTAEEAVDIANASPFGLVGYVWTRDIGRAQEVTRRLRAGVVWVNTSMMRELRAPFGGYKASGVGREGGEACAQLFTEEKTVTHRVLSPR